jgi:hypothetical protein
MKKLAFSLLTLLSLNAIAQTPQQKIVDRVTSTYSIHQSVRINNFIYSIGETEGSTHHPNLLKQDLDMNTEYITRVLRPSTDFDPIIMNQMIVTPDKHIIVAGNQLENGETPIWYFKMDTLLNIIWENDVSTVGEQEPNDLFINPSGGATILASETVGGIGGVNTIQIINFDANGDTLWTRKVATTPGVVSRYPIGYWDLNGDLIVRIRNGWDSEILKLDDQGNFISYSEYEASTGQKLNIDDACHHNGSTYLAGNVNGGSACIVKIDASGNVIWAKSYPEFSRFFKITVSANDEIYVSSYGSMLKTDIDGNPLIAKEYGKDPYSHNLYSDIVEINDHFLVSGLRQYQTNMTGYQLMLDSNLSTGTCYERVLPVSSNPIVVTKNTLLEPANGSLQSDILFYGPNSNQGWFLGATATDYILDNTIVPTFEISGDDCGGTCIGTISATAFGGDAPYNFQWSNGQSGSIASGICYQDEVTVELGDQLGCYLYDTIVMIQQTPVTEICMVTVDPTSTKNLVVWEKPNSQSIEGFAVYREVVGNYTLVGYVPYDSLSVFVDNTVNVNPNITSYRYKIATIDTCGNESALSDYHETIHLTVSPGLGNNVNLFWDNYEGSTFAYNRILRDTVGNGNWEVMDSVAGNVFTWTDTDPAVTVAGNYLIEIIFSSVCTATGKAQDYNSSRSNTTASVEGGPVAALNAADMNFSIYPNPANDQLFIESFESGDYMITVSDLSGRIVLQDWSVGTSQLDVSELKQGTYFITLSIEGRSSTQRFMKL